MKKSGTTTTTTEISMNEYTNGTILKQCDIHVPVQDKHIIVVPKRGIGMSINPIIPIINPRLKTNSKFA